MDIELKVEENKILDEVKNAWNYFLSDNPKKTPVISKIIDDCFLEVGKLIENRFVVMEEDLVYDNSVVGCWKGLLSNYKYEEFKTNEKISKIIKNSEFDIPTYEELQNLSSQENNTLFSVIDGFPEKIHRDTILCKKNYLLLAIKLSKSKYQSYDFWNALPLSSQYNDNGLFLPIKRLSIQDSQELNPKLVFFLFLFNNLTPIELKESVNYKFLSNFLHTKDNQNNIIKVDLKNNIEIDFLKYQITNIIKKDKIGTNMEQNQEMLLDILEKKNSLRHSINTNAKIQVFENMISLKDISLFHIEELTFEEDSPRREAFENVISTIRIDGIIFVYLLMGDKNGVSFYFGISKDLSYKKRLELEVDDIGKILKSSIEGNFRGSKVVEVEQDKKVILDKLNTMEKFAKIEGVPSINKDTEGFQGVDRLVDVMMGDEFVLLVLADPLTYQEVENIESSLYHIYNKLSPLAKVSIQESKGQTDTKGEGNTKNYSKTNGNSKSTAEGTSKGTSTGTSESNSTNKSNSSSTNHGGNEGSSNTKTEGTSKSETVGTSDTTNNSKAINKGTSESREFANKVANEWLSYIDEILLKRIDYGRSKGIFNSSIYLMTNEKGTSIKLGNTIKSLFSGSEDNKAPLHLEYIENKNEIKFIKNFQIPFSKLSLDKNYEQARMLLSKNSTKEASWLSTSELSVIATLPQKEVVGLALKEEIEFGLNVKRELVKDSDENIFLGNLVQSGKILDININLKKDNLDKHIFIAGVTGSGKTTTCQRILESANMPFMVIEPAKTEYRVMLNKRKDLLIFTLGDDRIAPFRLNPFEFFPHESISSRVDMIKANIEAAFDMEAAIPQIIESALYSSYEEYGWDIATSKNSKYENAFADGVFAFPTLNDLIKQTEKIVEKQGFDERLKKDYIGSIKARLQGLIIGSKGFMLNTHRSIDFMDLIERNVILELDEIKNGGEKSLIMGFVLININEALKAKHDEYKKSKKKFRHITLIEEAHRLLSKYSAGDSPNKKLGVETFADMLAEVRKYGESLIIVDQIPNKLTPEVLKNTNTKIVHKLFAQDDKEAIGNTMALDDDQKRFLSNLETGRAIISNQDFAKPIQIQIKQLDSVSTTTSEDISKEDIRNIALFYYQQHYKRGMILGIENLDIEPTLNQIEEALSFRINSVANHWFKIFENPKIDINSDNIKNHILENKLEDKLDFISKYITQKFYKDEEGFSISEKSIYVHSFLNKVLIENKIELSRDEQRILRIR